MPRPLTTFVRSAERGERTPHLDAIAAALRTPMVRASRRCCNRKATGSDFACAHNSSIKHSLANVFWIRKGERKGPVKNGERTVCVSARSLLMVPPPLHEPPAHPAK